MAAEFKRVFRVQGMDTNATPVFQMVPNSGRRYVALHDGAGMTLASSDTGVCTITEISESGLPIDDRATGATAAKSGDRFFRLNGISKGTAVIAAIGMNGFIPLMPAFLEIGVKDKLTQNVKFQSVRDNAGNHSTRPLAIVGQWLPSINYIWKRQANVEFVRQGSLSTVTVPQNLGATIMLGNGTLGAAGNAIAALGSTTADINVFFVWEIEETGGTPDVDAVTTIGTAHSGGPGTCIFEDAAGKDQMLSFAHELGHHMGIRHLTHRQIDLMWPTTGERGLNLTKDDVDTANP